MRNLQVICVALCLALVPASLVAAVYDGSVPLLCATLTIFDCDSAGTCQRVTAGSVNIPQFITINLQEKTISAPTNGAKTSTIRHVEPLDDRLILQGGENGRSWSIIVAKATGKLSATVVDDQVGFVIFGACTAR